MIYSAALESRRTCVFVVSQGSCMQLKAVNLCVCVCVAVCVFSEWEKNKMVKDDVIGPAVRMLSLHLCHLLEDNLIIDW